MFGDSKLFEDEWHKEKIRSQKRLCSWKERSEKDYSFIETETFQTFRIWHEYVISYLFLELSLLVTHTHTQSAYMNGVTNETNKQTNFEYLCVPTKKAVNVSKPIILLFAKVTCKR